MNDGPARFARNVMWIGAAQLVSQLIFGFAIVPALTKSYDSQTYGVWTQIYVTIGLLSTIIVMELIQSVVRFLAGETDSNKTRRAMGSMLFTVIAVGTVVLILASAFSPTISTLLFATSRYSAFVRLAFAWGFADALFLLFSAYFRARQRMRFLSFYIILLNLLMMGLVVGLASLRVELQWILVSIIAAEATTVVFFFYTIVKETGWPSPRFDRIGEFLAFSLPQVVGTILVWVVGYSDRYFITHFLGLREAGIYNTSNQLASVVRLCSAPLAYVLFPILTNLWETERFEELRSYVEYSNRLLLTIAIPLSAGLTILSQAIIRVLATNEFLAGRELVLLISAGGVFYGLFAINGNIIFLKKRTRLVPLIVGTASAVNVVLNDILISRVGILGAGISSLVCNGIMALIVTLMMRRSVHYAVDLGYLGKVAVATLAMCSSLYFLKVNGVLDIAMVAVMGTLVFGGVLFLLRGFSERDRRLMKSVVAAVVPAFNNRRRKKPANYQENQ